MNEFPKSRNRRITRSSTRGIAQSRNRHIAKSRVFQSPNRQIAKSPDSTGFSLLELVVSMLILSVVAASLARLTGAVERTSRRQPARSDAQQRLRVGLGAIARDLLQAGAGLNLAPFSGPLAGHLPPVRPARSGASRPDSELSFTQDRLSIAYVGDAGVVERHAYYHDVAGQRLMHYDGVETDAPVVDQVVLLRFEYFADADPSSVPWPDAGESSCLVLAGDPPMSLLRPLGGPGLHPVGAGDLTDGPVCGTAPERFDGDLLRVRLVRITLTVRTDGHDAVSAVGDPVATYSATLDVAPRQLNQPR
jgi:prepilin-type N-terminal cleavage/methylation domain-containing protein